MKKTLLIFLALACLAGCNSKDKMPREAKPVDSKLIPQMAIEKLPAVNFFYLPVNGDYSQHPAVIEKLSRFLVEANISSKNCTGIYPEDPDAVPVKELDWQVGYQVPKEVQEPEGDEFKVRTLEGTTALVVQSSVRNSAIHGIYCKIWLLEHGYVQTHPTRMIYHMDSDKPEAQSTTIIFPVVKRTRDIPVITDCTMEHRVEGEH